jgi:predicted ATPase
VLVELAPVGQSEVLAAVLAATGRELRTETMAERLGALDRVVDALFGRETLLVLDNCEHVIGEAARVAQDLLGALPQLRILATSREPLAIPGEAFVAVGSLAHPGDGDVDDLLAYPAVELFRQRAAAARGRDLDAAEIPVAGLICARLDGLPLALELAAARLRTMGLDEVLDGLEHRFTLLTGGYRTALPRHQTLRAMIDWSWSLLGNEERFALARLAVFPAGVHAGDAPELAAAMGLASASVFDSLVDKSLVQRSRGRYRTLETIREYGIERLAEQQETAEARTVQATFERDRARAVDRLMRGPRITEAIEWFDAEEDNISAALRFSVATPLPEVAVELASACAWYWIIRDRQDDARAWFPAVLPLAAGLDSEESHVMRLIEPIAAAFGGQVGEDGDPNLVLERAAGLLVPLTALRSGPESHDIVQIIPPVIAAFAAVAGEADWMVRVRLPRGEELGLSPWPVALLHVLRAAMAQNRGDVEELGTESELAFGMFGEIGDRWGLALSSQMRAEWLIVNGRLEEALEISDSATANLRRITSSWDLAQQQGQAITALVRLGRIDDARKRIAAVLAEADAAGSSRARLQAYVTAAVVDIQVGDLPGAERRLAMIDDLAAGWPNEPPQLKAMIATVRAGLLIQRGDPDAAEPHMRAAAAAAFASHDQPVIGLVAINLGLLALARGDIPRALRAVDLATSLIGAHDATNPHVRQIEEAAERAGIRRADSVELTRPKALEALQHLVDEA